MPQIVKLKSSNIDPIDYTIFGLLLIFGVFGCSIGLMYSGSIWFLYIILPSILIMLWQSWMFSIQFGPTYKFWFLIPLAPYRLRLYARDESEWVGQFKDKHFVFVDDGQMLMFKSPATILKLQGKRIEHVFGTN